MNEKKEVKKKESVANEKTKVNCKERINDNRDIKEKEYINRDTFMERIFIMLFSLLVIGFLIESLITKNQNELFVVLILGSVLLAEMYRTILLKRSAVRDKMLLVEYFEIIELQNNTIIKAIKYIDKLKKLKQNKTIKD